MGRVKFLKICPKSTNENSNRCFTAQKCHFDTNLDLKSSMILIVSFPSSFTRIEWAGASKFHFYFIFNFLPKNLIFCPPRIYFFARFFNQQSLTKIYFDSWFFTVLLAFSSSDCFWMIPWTFLYTFYWKSMLKNDLLWFWIFQISVNTVIKKWAKN